MRIRESSVPVNRFDPPPVGTTVTLRVATPVGPIGIVGTIVEISGEAWSVRRRDGSIATVEASSVLAGRVVPPSRAARASVAEVERMAALGWRGLEVARLGEWLLRAGSGFTGRANSALPVGDPGCNPATALEMVRTWYSDRGLTPRLQVPDGEVPDELLRLLDGQGWATSPEVWVMTGEVGHTLRAAQTPSADLEIRLDAEPDAGWLAGYRQDGGNLPDAAHTILVNHPQVVFASLRRDGHTVAIARAAVDQRWAGLFAVEVTPNERRAGLGSVVSAAALRWAAQQGARRSYLQVTAENTAAISLYERLGYEQHHRYRYRTGAR
jgi:GNAT superfamily N-acetyltransferase